MLVDVDGGPRWLMEKKEIVVRMARGLVFEGCFLLK
jgi:hypothetical protein